MDWDYYSKYGGYKNRRMDTINTTIISSSPEYSDVIKALDELDAYQRDDYVFPQWMERVRKACIDTNADDMFFAGVLIGILTERNNWSLVG